MNMFCLPGWGFSKGWLLPVKYNLYWNLNNRRSRPVTALLCHEFECVNRMNLVQNRVLWPVFRDRRQKLLTEHQDGLFEFYVLRITLFQSDSCDGKLLSYNQVFVVYFFVFNISHSTSLSALHSVFWASQNWNISSPPTHCFHKFQLFVLSVYSYSLQREPQNKHHGK